MGKLRSKLTSMPDGFGLTDEILKWGASKNHARLEERMEVFKLKALANGYLYANWTAAFMESVRADWAGFNAKPAVGGHASQRLFQRAAPVAIAPMPDAVRKLVRLH